MSVFTFTLNVALNRSHITVCTACPINILLFVVSHSGDRLGNCPCSSPVLIIYHSTHYSLINTARNFFSKLFADHVQVACHTHDIQRRDHVTSRRERWPLEWELRVTLRYHMTSSTWNVRWKALKEIDQVARESSRPKSCRLKPKSCCPKFK